MLIARECSLSVLVPEGYANIIWKDCKMVERAAQVMMLEAKDLYQLDVIDKIVPETDK